MNTDDPTLTAFALDEPDPSERAEIERLLMEDSAAAGTVLATRAFAGEMRTRLQTERMPGLDELRRAELLREFAAVTPRKVTAFPGHATVWAAAAAGVLVGVSWALILPALNSMSRDRNLAKAREGGIPDGSQVRVALAQEVPAAAGPNPTPRPAAESLTLTVRLPEPQFHFPDRFLIDRKQPLWWGGPGIVFDGSTTTIPPTEPPIWLHGQQEMPNVIDLARPIFFKPTPNR